MLYINESYSKQSHHNIIKRIIVRIFLDFLSSLSLCSIPFFSSPSSSNLLHCLLNRTIPHLSSLLYLFLQLISNLPLKVILCFLNLALLIMNFEFLLNFHFPFLFLFLDLGFHKYFIHDIVPIIIALVDYRYLF